VHIYQETNKKAFTNTSGLTWDKVKFTH